MNRSKLPKSAAQWSGKPVYKHVFLKAIVNHINRTGLSPQLLLSCGADQAKGLIKQRSEDIECQSDIARATKLGALKHQKHC